MFFNLIYKYYIVIVKDFINVYKDNFICVVLLKKKCIYFFKCINVFFYYIVFKVIYVLVLFWGWGSVVVVCRVCGLLLIRGVFRVMLELKMINEIWIFVFWIFRFCIKLVMECFREL